MSHHDHESATSARPQSQEADEFMREAIKEAQTGMAEGGIPIGSVLVRGGRIIGRGHNRRIQNQDPTAHGEMECLRNAGRVGSYRDTVLYSTLMPCAMCAGTAIQFRIPKVVAGEDRTFPSARKLMEDAGIEVVDLNLDECYEMLQEFARKNPQLWQEDIGEL
jgi:cytosine deaminase